MIALIGMAGSAVLGAAAGFFVSRFAGFAKDQLQKLEDINDGY